MPTREKRSRSITPALRLHLDCTLGAVRRGAIQFRAFLENRGLAEKDIWACELAFVEGCNNAVQHTPRAKVSQQIVVELLVATGSIELRINDHSKGCEFPEQVELPPAENESGRGIFLMRTLMDQVTYIRSDSSNCLVLKKAVTGI
jgi:anti-sigma regulatory factor (Ser/Thr protein kinase)